MTDSFPKRVNSNVLTGILCVFRVNVEMITSVVIELQVGAGIVHNRRKIITNSYCNANNLQQ
jgi:hypothetical protein